MRKTTQQEPSLCSIILLNDINIVFEAEWRDNCVWIQNKDQIDKLFASGAFGKGTLSRSIPTFVETNKSNNDPTKFHRRKKLKTDEKEKISVTLPDDFIEPLQLNLYDAFFIVFCFENKLNIKRGDQIISEPSELWPLCCRSDPQFITHYAAYHFYRSRGWIAKSGIKYGVDFLLYEDSPQFVHAEFGVRVVAEYDSASAGSDGAAKLSDELQQASDTCHPTDDTQPPSGVSWMLLNNLNRVSETVKKGLLLSVVLWPHNVARPGPEATDDDYNAILPQLSLFSVREIQFGRWKPSKTRD